METRIILFIFFSIISFNLFCQSNTKITGFIPDLADSTAFISLYIKDPKSLTFNQEDMFEIALSNGKFSFDFSIQEPRIAVITLNNIHICLPGSYGILIEPTDSLHIAIPDIKNLGLMNIIITGKGSAKAELQKSMLNAILPIYKADPPYNEQTIQYKFSTVDKKLDAIDRVLYSFRGNISDIGKEILRGYQYHYVLDMLFISATRNENDSLRFLFDSYIVNKNRIDPVLQKSVVNYFPHHVISNYVLLSEFNNPIDFGGEKFRLDHPVEYTDMILRYLNNNETVRDYLIADVVTKLLKKERFNIQSKLVYETFRSNVDSNSLFYNEVTEMYNYMESNLKAGTPFFSFKLPDSTGKIYRLEDFRGKVLVLDFWFNGCAGCAQMARALDSLENYFSADEVQFVSINVDSKKLWLAGIEKYTSKNSLNLYTAEQKTEHPLIKYLNFSTYPKLVVIDRNGNLMPNPPDPRNKSKEFINMINSL